MDKWSIEQSTLQRRCVGPRVDIQVRSQSIAAKQSCVGRTWKNLPVVDSRIAESACNTVKCCFVIVKHTVLHVFPSCALTADWCSNAVYSVCHDRVVSAVAVADPTLRCCSAIRITAALSIRVARRDAVCSVPRWRYKTG